MAETVTVTRDRVALDLILYRRYGVAGQSLVAAALELNPGLAKLGSILPIGTVVTLPDAPVVSPAATRDVVDLFG